MVPQKFPASLSAGGPSLSMLQMHILIQQNMEQHKFGLMLQGFDQKKELKARPETCAPALDRKVPATQQSSLGLFAIIWKRGLKIMGLRDLTRRLIKPRTSAACIVFKNEMIRNM